jgi:Arc/MetJ family transcription regulator
MRSRRPRTSKWVISGLVCLWYTARRRRKFAVPSSVSCIFPRVYPASVIKRTNINLDMDLVNQAARQLGTERTTDTVHQALREVIARAHRARLAQRDFEDLTPDALEAMRRPFGRTS